MASKVGIAYVNTLEAAQFFKNISRNTLPGTSGSLTGNSPLVVEITASKVGIACVITLEAELFFTNISGNKQLGAVRLRSLYSANCFRSIDTYFSQFRFTKFFSKFSKFREL
ncbi:hypothetical protein T11_13285 [Trichinella zimbabwensis]|uniref:Uncharacterized protein n=1 Tax=Trichinella zimbabwensis TaxID=268475 RepID=A0A0V1GUU1_9BILA|nr:hypothetical protein T11_13285 [Trichinella zimbabwensis]